MTEPSNIDWDKLNINTSVEDFSINRDGIDEYLWDYDNDGEVDAIGSFGERRWYAPRYKDKSNYSKLMTPEIRKKASEYRQKGIELSKLLYEEAYRLHIEEKAKNYIEKDRSEDK